ncbi:MAG: hypothetical protein ABI968_07400 [Acidobacteriota bacterium]
MLRCRGIENQAERGIFRVLDDDQPTPLVSLAQVARLADLLLRENELSGRFAVTPDGSLALELPAEERTFFHNGIVFAALDAFNDPVKNPTLSLLAEPSEE